ncbi:RagB/SusD family nutrient uptake outer membrane protein [Muricauda brasiliensis]|uniref:RagB/SusD family nutrient uptake outer membrane protein n=1 Tax=Muricauda brasiliensis TaxID=2162892 RepID=UPI000D3824A7|nr:RagB/SusD family nutrient uptake outer membrane protein [Muricauda brasiliensis]
MKNIYGIVLLTMLLFGCDKEWLEIKQDKQLVVPETLTDLQALLDDSANINFGRFPYLGVVGADNFYLLDEDWEGMDPEQHNAYIWAEDIYEGNTSYNYNTLHLAILYTNIVLERIEDINPSVEEQEMWDNVKGSALFYRSWMFYQLVQIYAKQYDPTTADSDLGIALRLESDVNIKSKRASVQETYDQIIKDTEAAIGLLPSTPLVQTRPSKLAANGLLAKTYLQMGDYAEALRYATAYLAIDNTLMDYDSLDATDNYPFELFNVETAFCSTIYPFSTILNTHHIDSTLYNSYDGNDLRKTLYYFDDNGRMAFKGTYAGSSRQFSGMANDEFYLIAAECEARLGNQSGSMQYLNALLSTRWAEGTYQPYVANDANDALGIVLRERRKSLVFRGIRWHDLKRLNMEADFAITLERHINGEIYTLPPNDLRYVLPFPDEVIELSDIEQNPR